MRLFEEIHDNQCNEGVDEGADRKQRQIDFLIESLLPRHPPHALSRNYPERLGYCLDEVSRECPNDG